MLIVRMREEELPVRAIKQDTVLVTGGAGFIGSNLCDRLIDTGANVICLDNLQTGRVENYGLWIAAGLAIVVLVYATVVR